MHACPLLQTIPPPYQPVHPTLPFIPLLPITIPCLSDQCISLLSMPRSWLCRFFIHTSLRLPCWSVCFLFCFAVLCILSGLAVVLVVRRVLITVLYLFSWCLVITIVLLILIVPCVGLQCVIMVYPDHTHFLLVFYQELT